jgi:hypothetical protein
VKKLASCNSAQYKPSTVSDAENLITSCHQLHFAISEAKHSQGAILFLPFAFIGCKNTMYNLSK